ncbi:MAG: glycosyltransferase, partial [Candidatus Omnitrophota bacterium]|nr:glycosyltransferase [Candidatus Omnitrophota bacterium]
MPLSSATTRILLLGNDPADAQWSMLEYGEQLHRALTTLSGGNPRIILRAPDSRWWIRRGRFSRAAGMYLSRYLLYPRLLRGETAGPAHILDHGNAWLIRFLDPARTVISCHDLIPLVLQTWKKSYFPWFSERAFREALSGLSRAARILTISECTKKDIVERLGCDPGRISVAPMGIDPGFRPASSPEETARARRTLRLPGGTLVAHVGQTASYKNIDGILKTLPLLDKSVQLIRAGPL